MKGCSQKPVSQNVSAGYAALIFYIIDRKRPDVAFYKSGMTSPPYAKAATIRKAGWTRNFVKAAKEISAMTSD
ncbi:hypothetical protein J41TS8_10700 [Bacillus sp. J41TS8]|nr:hypothetical protein J41TS8_10700 [Bacillus sp. J41TS8]